MWPQPSYASICWRGLPWGTGRAGRCTRVPGAYGSSGKARPDRFELWIWPDAGFGLGSRLISNIPMNNDSAMLFFIGTISLMLPAFLQALRYTAGFQAVAQKCRGERGRGRLRDGEPAVVHGVEVGRVGKGLRALYQSTKLLRPRCARAHAPPYASPSRALSQQFLVLL